MIKLKAIAAAVALAAVAGQASATVATATTGNGELFLNVWDANGSYTRDLGITLNDFLPTAAGTGVTAFGYQKSFAADQTFSTWLSTANAAGVKWSVTAGDSKTAIVPGVDATGKQRYLVTTNVALAPSTMQTEGQVVSGWGLGIDTFLGKINVKTGQISGTSGTAFNGSSTAFVGEQAYAGGTLWGAKMGNKTNFDITAGLGQSANFYLVTAVTGTTKAPFDQFDNAAGASKWTLASDGNLTYTAAVAAVPEPGTWALFMAGLLGVGAIARRRLSA